MASAGGYSGKAAAELYSVSILVVGGLVAKNQEEKKVITRLLLMLMGRSPSSAKLRLSSQLCM
jgi:hypothetical protein